MALFKNPTESHAHALQVLNLLREYDTFLESLSSVADMGCGSGLTSKWWAELTTRDDVPEPLNYIVYAVDQNIKQLDPEVVNTKNVKVIEGNFEERLIPRNVDLIWAHDVFQYSRDPLKCLAMWKSTMTVNGMLVLSIPQTTYWDHEHGRLIVSNHSNQYYSYNVLNLMYMLALSGFDCNDAFFYREPNTPWLYAAVYASHAEPVTAHATWYELAERGLINESIVDSINKYGYARLEDTVVRWLDKDYYQITD